MSSLSPVYIAGLSARNRLTDARDEVHRLTEHLSDEKRREVISIYNRLCSVQGTLEALLEDVPTTVPDNDSPIPSNGRRNVVISLPSVAESICIPVSRVDWTSEEGQPFVSLQIQMTDAHTVTTATAPTEREARKQLILRVMLALKLQHDVILGKVPGLPELPRQYYPMFDFGT